MPFSQQTRSLTARIAVLSLLAVFSLMCRMPAGAWSYHTHRKIVSDTLSFMPSAFQDRFRPFKDPMMQGSTDPDSLLKDFMNHVYHVNRRNGHESASRIGDLCRQAAEQMKRGSPDAEIAYTLGLIAHYVADINQPLHTAGSEADAEEGEYHGKFEKDVQSRLTKVPVPVPSAYSPVIDPERRVREMAEIASRQYGRIGAAYRTGRGVYDVEDIVNEQYAAAVRNLADFWLGIAEQGNMRIQLVRPASVSQDLSLLQLDQAQAFPASKSGPININTATYDQLVNIPGIGEKRAQAIITARRTQPFSSIRDLANVTYTASGKKAFGVNLIDRLSELLTTK